MTFCVIYFFWKLYRVCTLLNCNKYSYKCLTMWFLFYKGRPREHSLSLGEKNKEKKDNRKTKYKKIR